ncbi:MAG TPA: hypothetical protein VMU82_20000 [Acetobacteraceae bacterium]|nr:hypothetical protein [Acetobacteraceae bacterium]
MKKYLVAAALLAVATMPAMAADSVTVSIHGLGGLLGDLDALLASLLGSLNLGGLLGGGL